MHRTNNAVIMQTEQLGCIEALEEELRSSRAKMAELEVKTTEQDRVIAQLVGDNLEHLQDNMCLTAHITSSSDRMAQLEHRLGQVGSVLMGMIEGQMEGEATSEALGKQRRKCQGCRAARGRLLLETMGMTGLGTRSDWSLERWGR